MTALARLSAALFASKGDESGLTLSQLSLSFGVIALFMVVVYSGGSFLGENVHEAVSPAFRWRIP